VSVLYHRWDAAPTSGSDQQRYHQQTHRVIHVIDGDTVILDAREGKRDVRVRLLGIDAPETNATTDQPPMYWAQQATEALRDLVEDREVSLVLESTDTR